jgi:predicted RNA-binding protein YlqC (UPF0109 family)
MLELARHLLEPIVTHRDALQIRAVEGDAAIILEAIVHADDRDMLEQDGGRTLRAIRTVLSAAAGREKATLDLVEAFDAEGGEE